MGALTGNGRTGGELRIGVLGTGRIGSLHAELLQTRVAHARVTRIHDAVPAAAEAVGARLGIPLAATADELVAAPDVDAVAISTPTDTHVDLVVAAARAGKAIFCEKPVSLDLATVDRGLAVVREAGVPFQIGFNRRFDPAHAAVRAAVADGAIGTPHIVRITSRDPAPPPLEYVRRSGGLFLDMTIHDFDMARFVSGSEVVAVSAHGARRIRPDYAEAGDVDTALITLEHASGCLTSIDNSRQAPYGYDQRVEVHGELGMAASDNVPEHTTTIRTARGTLRSRASHFFLERYTASFVAEWTAFVDAVLAGTATPVGPEDARAPLVIGLAARRAMEERRPVAIAEIDTLTRAA